ncbi:MAG: glycosyltransferase 87 family protein [Pseudanabaenaceae cyanobacterium]
MRLVLMSFPNGFSIDINSFKAWSMALLVYGLPNFYGSGWCDYPPGYMYVLWLTGQIYQWFDPFLLHTDQNLLTFLIKLVPAVADLGASLLIFYILCNITSVKSAQIGAIIYAFNPVLIFLSSVWGQIDSVVIFLMLATVYLLLKDKFVLAIIITSLTVIVKPQGLFLAPILIFSQLRQRSLWQWLLGITASLVSVWLSVLPFVWQKIEPSSLLSWLSTPWHFLYKQFIAGANVYPYATVNAFNVWIMANWQSDRSVWLGMSYQTIGLLLLVVVLVWVAVLLLRNPTSLFTATALLLIAVFMLGTRMHERYIVYALPFLLIAGSYINKVKFLYGLFTVTALVNISYVYVEYNYESLWHNIPVYLQQVMPIAVAVCNLGLFIGLVVLSNYSLGTLQSKSSESLGVTTII